MALTCSNVKRGVACIVPLVGGCSQPQQLQDQLFLSPVYGTMKSDT